MKMRILLSGFFALLSLIIMIFAVIRAYFGDYGIASIMVGVGLAFAFAAQASGE